MGKAFPNPAPLQGRFTAPQTHLVVMEYNAVDLAGTATAGLRLGGTTSPGRALIPFPGWVRAMAVRSNEARTAGTATFEVLIGGVDAGAEFDVVLNATDTQTAYKTYPHREALALRPGDDVQVRADTSGWTPTTADVIATLWLEVRDVLA